MSDKNTAPIDTSSSDSESEEIEAAVGDSKQPRDIFHWITIVCFAISASFWLVAVFLYHPKPWWVIQNAFVALAVCFVADSVVACTLPGIEKRLILMHFALGVVQNTLYVTLFVISPSLFGLWWNSIFSGYYLFTWVMMLTQRRQFFPMLRLFLTVHHALSFFIVGIWIIVGHCCSEDDNGNIVLFYRCIVIWLSGDIWFCVQNIYRSLRPKTDKEFIRRIQVFTFGIERIHRSLAYFQYVTVPISDLSTLLWVALGSGLFMDALDASFQLNSLCTYYKAKKQQRKKSGFTDDIESPAPKRYSCASTAPATSDRSMLVG